MNVLEFFSKLKPRYINKTQIQKDFDVESCISGIMQDSISLWNDIYTGDAPWLNYNNGFMNASYNPQEHVKSSNVSKIVVSELARLSTLDIDIEITGSARANYLQEIINHLKSNVRDKLEYGCAVGGFIFKPNGKGFDYVFPDNFIPCGVDINGEIVSCLFFDVVNRNETKYIRAECHELKDDGIYIIRNKAYEAKSDSDYLKRIDLNKVPEWADIQEEIELCGIEKPLFSYFKIPMANNIDVNSPLGISSFSSCVEQIEDVDVAYTRLSDEIFISNKIVFVSQAAINGQDIRQKLPNFVVGLEFGINEDNTVSEHNPVLQTTVRKEGINFLLSLIGYQCGFSNGYFEFNEKTGLVTATQVEADQQRTVQTVCDIRKSLQSAIDNLIYALNVYADIYKLAPAGSYEVNYYFKDITENPEEDRNRAIELVTKGILPKWKYLVDYEGYTEEEARSLVKDAEKKDMEGSNE